MYVFLQDVFLVCLVLENCSNSEKSYNHKCKQNLQYLEVIVILIVWTLVFVRVLDFITTLHYLG
jgi:hypothetical protein